MHVDTDVILDWQQRGINARILGRKAADNPVLPYLSKSDCKPEQEGWMQKAEAWLFGWSIEDALRT